jgi:methionyl-tRNA formyltransferase
MRLMSGRGLSALILGAPNPVSMGIARGWMMAGHAISSIWYPERVGKSKSYVQDRELSKRAPGVTMHGLAERARLPVRPVSPFSQWVECAAVAKKLNPDVVLSLLYMDRITSAFLEAFPGKVLNLHPSLLPAYRGAAPIFNMLWDRTITRYSGLTLHLVSPEFDRGDTLGRSTVPFPADANLSVYYMELVKAGTTLITRQIPAFLSGQVNPEAQVNAHDAPQGSRKLSEAILSRSLAAEHIAWLCKTIPQMTPLRIEGLPNNVAVKEFVSAEARTTGAPAVIISDLAEFDAQDARVKLRIARI